MKTRLITWLITLSALLDTLYGVLAENSGLLAELGISPKVTKVILVVGLIWTAFSKKLELVKTPVQGIANGQVPPIKDEK